MTQSSRREIPAPRTSTFPPPQAAPRIGLAFLRSASFDGRPAAKTRPATVPQESQTRSGVASQLHVKLTEYPCRSSRCGCESAGAPPDVCQRRLASRKNSRHITPRKKPFRSSAEKWRWGREQASDPKQALRPSFHDRRREASLMEADIKAMFTWTKVPRHPPPNRAGEIAHTCAPRTNLILACERP